MTLAPGARIGLQLEGPDEELFEIAEFKGQGHFGEVYRAVGLTSGLQVAVKLLQISSLIDPSTRTALLNEIELAGQIVHANVVQVLHADKGTNPSIGPY